MLTSTQLYNQLLNHKLFSKTINFNLSRIKLALNKLDHPEKKLQNVIQIIGSDGKFSVLRSLRYFIEENKQTVSTHGSSLIDIRAILMEKEYLSTKIKKLLKL